MKKLIVAILFSLSLTTLLPSGAFARPAAVSRGNTNSAECVFNNDVDTCQSTNPTIEIYLYNNGDTSQCSFDMQVDWGDSSPVQDITIQGGPTGPEFLANHVYSSPGTYQIYVSGSVLSGNCWFTPGGWQFTLLPSLITSPASGDIIALTDANYLQPQPKNNERTPKHRHLIVRGATQCSCTILVNGTQATVSGHTWTADLPDPQLGKQTITAQSSDGLTDTIDITLVDLVVANPVENQKLSLTASPSMPDFAAQVQVNGLPQDSSLSTTSFTWNLEAINRYVSRKANAKTGTWNDDKRVIATGTTTGTEASWHPDYHQAILGGVGYLGVKASLPGVLDGPTLSEPRWIDLPGANPDVATIKTFLNDHVTPADADTLTHILCIESHYRQFGIGPAGRPAAAKSTLIPSDWKMNSLQPLFGPPAGIGIAQLDPATFPDEQWKWQTNILGGISLYKDKENNARHWQVVNQQRLDTQRRNDLNSVNTVRAKHHLRPITVDRLIVPAYTAEQLKRDTIRQYNGHHEYVIAAHYVISSNHLTVDVSGPAEWVTQPNLSDYVNKVLACK